MASNSDEIDLKENNFMAEMVEVRVKMYACKVCGIRYDNMESMKQHYNEVHPTAVPAEEESKLQTIKEEILDEDEEVQITTASTSDFVFVDEDGQQIQLPEGFQLGENSVIFTDASENQFLLQVVPRENNIEEQLIEAAQETVEQTVNSERRQTRRQAATATSAAVASTTDVPPKTPGKRGRKRKNPLIEQQPKIVPQLGVSTRSKRMVVPNIKSEFVYDDTPQPNEEVEELEAGPTYTLIEDDSGIITAYQVPNEVSRTKEKLPTDNEYNENVDNEEEDYPADYTPTSKTKKGRQVEPKDDSHLRKFPCPFQGCKYVAKYRSNLWDHKKTHTGEKPYACNWPSCSMRFSQTHQLKLHLRSHTGERPYVCDWPGCNSAFSQKPGLKSHMLTHTGEKPFKCDFPGCEWTFRLKGALTDHKRAIHENAKKHVCEWPGCNKRFLQQCHLKKHIMGHADIKPFACDWPNCNYKAVTMAYVTNHRKIHTGEKNYECTFPNCNKRFVKSSHVNRHRQRCHPELFLVVEGEDGDIYEDEQEDSEQNDGEIVMNGENYIIEMKKENIEEVLN